MEKKRVIVWGTGNVASIAIRCLAGREDVELVGVYGHPEFDKAKIGMDSGLLDGFQKNNVLITSDEDALIALKPDCALVATSIPGPNGNVLTANLMKKFLDAKINVVSSSIAGLICPEDYPDKEIVDIISAAATENEVSFFAGGLSPGVLEDVTVRLLTGVNTIKKITVSEMYFMHTMPNAIWTEDFYGFNRTLDYKPQADAPGFQLATWGMSVAHIAKALGYKVDEYKETYERYITDVDIPVAYGTIKAGTCSAVRYGITGVINGKEVISVDHIMRMGENTAPNWPVAHRDGLMQIIVDGDPNIECTFGSGRAAKSENITYEAYVSTACSLVNAIPYVCDAKPGIVTTLELPATVPTSALRTDDMDVAHKVFS